jgi:hypothetical protein
MDERKEKSVCLDDGTMFQDGYESCKDVYCFHCVDGKWETRPWIGAVLDLSEVV